MALGKGKGAVKVVSFDLSASFVQSVADGDAVFAIDQRQFLQGYHSTFTLSGLFNFRSPASRLGILSIAAAMLLTGGEFDPSIGSLAAFAGKVVIRLIYTGFDQGWFQVFLGGMLQLPVIFNSAIRKCATGGTVMPHFSDEPIIKLDNIEKHCGNVVALAGMSFDVLPGECQGLLGDNGTGKSASSRPCRASPSRPGARSPLTANRWTSPRRLTRGRPGLP